MKKKWLDDNQTSTDIPVKNDDLIENNVTIPSKTKVASLLGLEKSTAKSDNDIDKTNETRPFVTFLW